MTGVYTGRSPKDKFFVKNEASENSVDVYKRQVLTCISHYIQIEVFPIVVSDCIYHLLNGHGFKPFQMCIRDSYFTIILLFGSQLNTVQIELCCMIL